MSTRDQTYVLPAWFRNLELEKGDDDWDRSTRVVGFTSWYRHGVSETALKWHKDPISNSIYRPLIYIFLDADEALEIQRLLL